jgi:hypothetical protein
MSETPITDCEECLPPAEAFGVIASETRLSILEALWAADEEVQSFTDLRKAVDMDDSAQFNYHLGKLRGQFVRETDDGYRLAHAGREVIRAVVAGTFNEQPELDPFAVEGDCPDCDGDLLARYEDEVVTIECGECERLLIRYSFPPGGLADRTPAELVADFDQRVRHFHCLMADGVCPHCGGTVESSIYRKDEDMPFELAIRHDCQRCQHDLKTTLGMVVLDHVEVVSFFRDHGIDLNDVPSWTMAWCLDNSHVTVTSEDPWRLALTVPCEDEQLRLVVNEDLRVVESERRPAVEDPTAPATGVEEPTGDPADD